MTREEIESQLHEDTELFRKTFPYLNEEELTCISGLRLIVAHALMDHPMRLRDPEGARRVAESVTTLIGQLVLATENRMKVAAELKAALE